MKLPQVKGSNLARQKMAFPDDFAGQINLVFIAFLRWHQDQVDESIILWNSWRKNTLDSTIMNFPPYQVGDSFYRTFLNEGMRAGIPDESTRARLQDHSFWISAHFRNPSILTASRTYGFTCLKNRVTCCGVQREVSRRKRAKLYVIFWISPSSKLSICDRGN